jgi:hypothetical protein
LNTFISPNWVSTDSALGFKNNLRLLGQFDRHWEKMWRNKPDGAQIGFTAQVRIEQRWQVFEGQALQQQAVLNQTVPISINHQFQVAHGWSSADDALVVEEVRERYDMPAGRAMANKWDVVAGQEVYRSVYFQAGSPGVPLSADQTWIDQVSKLNNVAVPEGYCAVLDPKTQGKLVGANLGAFNPQPQISHYFKTGQFNEGAFGVDEWMKDPNIPTHVTGTFTSSTPLVDGALQTGSTLLLKGFGTYALNAGDTFYVLGVNAVNPVSYVDTGDQQAFSIQAAIAGAGGALVTISPPIITSGPLQTVTASPANNASVSFVGATGTVNATMAAQSSRQSLLFNPAAFACVFADLPAKLAGAVAGRTSEAVGESDRLSMRYVDQYNIQTDQLPRRLDTIGGVATILPYYAIRMWS